MGFPKLQYPTYSIELLSVGSVMYRPFVSKEEKLLLMALKGQDKDEITNTVKQILTNCVVSPANFDVDNLATFDLEYLFIQIRAKSVGDSVDISFKGREGTDCTECKKDKKFLLDLREIAIKVDPKHTKKIQLDDKIGVTMKYPTPSLWVDLMELRSNYSPDLEYELLAKCLDVVYDNESSFDVDSSNLTEAIGWLESLPSPYMAKIREFFDTMPHLEHVIDLSCKKCGHKEDYVLSGLESFFG